MWKCSNCAEDVDDGLEVCWNCETDKSGLLPDGAVASPDANDDPELRQFLNRKHGPKECAFCQSPLRFAGTRGLHEGKNWGVLGDLAEVFVGHTNLDMYLCPLCLRVEFFVSKPIA
jgi:hypothetical protein